MMNFSFIVNKYEIRLQLFTFSGYFIHTGEESKLTLQFHSPCQCTPKEELSKLNTTDMHVLTHAMCEHATVPWNTCENSGAVSVYYFE